MIAIKRTPRWPDPRVKPPYGAAGVNWGHPLAQGLEIVWVMHEGAGTPIDLVRSRQSSFEGTGVSGKIRWAPTVWGSGLDFPINSLSVGTQYVTTPAPSLGTAASIVAGLRCAENTPLSTANTGLITTKTIADNSHYPWVDGVIYMGALNTNRATLGNNSAFDKTKPHQIAVTSDETANQWAFFQNAAQFGSTQTAPATSVSGTDNLKVGASQSDALYAFHGQWNYFYLYRRAITLNEIAFLSSEPYAFLRPILRRRYFVPAATPDFALDDTGLSVTPAPTRRVVPVW